MNDASRMAKHGSLEDLVSVALTDEKEKALYACMAVCKDNKDSLSVIYDQSFGLRGGYQDIF